MSWLGANAAIKYLQGEARVGGKRRAACLWETGRISVLPGLREVWQEGREEKRPVRC